MAQPPFPAAPATELATVPQRLQKGARILTCDVRGFLKDGHALKCVIKMAWCFLIGNHSGTAVRFTLPKNHFSKLEKHKPKQPNSCWDRWIPISTIWREFVGRLEISGFVAHHGFCTLRF